MDFSIQDREGQILYQTAHWQSDLETLCSQQQEKNERKLKTVRDVKIKRLRRREKKFLEQEEGREGSSQSESEEAEEEGITDQNKGMIFYADEYQVSRALKICLKTMRRGEVCEMEVLNERPSKRETLLKRLSYGVDHTLLAARLDLPSTTYLKYCV